jgi:hypothetical protein
MAKAAVELSKKVALSLFLQTRGATGALVNGSVKSSIVIQAHKASAPMSLDHLD